MTLIRKYWLAVAIGAVFVLGIALACVGVFAAGPMMAPSPPRISEVMVRPITGQDGSFLAFHVAAKIVVVEYHPNGVVDTHQIGSIEFDLAKTNGVVEVGGEILDDKEAMDHFAAIMLREWGKSNPASLPQRRAMRGRSGVPK